MKILLVDDDKVMLRLLDAMLRTMGHEVVQAYDGLQAWELLRDGGINFVLSDWCMPGMDGVELCRRLRAAELHHYVYVVLFTGREQDDDLVIAMEAGADDFLTKPVKGKELKARIEAGKRVLSLEASLTQKNQALEQANRALQESQQRLKNDLAAAARVQQELLPQSPLTSMPVRMAWDLLPADELAGDIFNFFSLGDEHLGFYLVDVSGHGIPAAMLSVYLAKTLSAEPRPDSLVRSSMKGEQKMQESEKRFLSHFSYRRKTTSDPVTKPYREPKDVVTYLNTHFQATEDNMQYFTMIYGVLDVHSGKGALCQAGHPYPLICRCDGSVQRLGEGGFPVGLVPEAEYEQVPFQLHPGDRLWIYSDGITECFNPGQEAFGESRLAGFLQESRALTLQDSVDQLKHSLSDWHAPGESKQNFADDVSLLAMEIPSSD